MHEDMVLLNRMSARTLDDREAREGVCQGREPPVKRNEIDAT